MWLYSIAIALLIVHVTADNVTASDECPAEGIWSGLLEEWALTPTGNDRHGRILAVPTSQDYYVIERLDRPPPPHSPHGHHGPHGPHGPHGHRGPPPKHGPPQMFDQSQGPFAYDEWHPAPPADTKVVNRPPNPYKDQYKPNYQSPPPNQQIPVNGPQSQGPSPPAGGSGPYQPSSQGPPPPPGGPGSYQPSYQGPPPPHRGPGPYPQPSSQDRIGEMPPPPPPHRKQVSETDLYLLSAIEKLVWRVDIMEKRLRKMEESMLYLISESQPQPEPCVENFTRLGEICYHFSPEAVDWKSANLRCRKLRANLVELNDDGERKKLQNAMLVDKKIKGNDVWTGGLNPGLLWIWSHSARPVFANTTTSSNSTAAVGDGRCLAWVHDPALKTYVYRGQDCALRHRFICEKEEDKEKISNEIDRVSRMMKEGKSRKPKIMWTDSDSKDEQDQLL